MNNFNYWGLSHFLGGVAVGIIVGFLLFYFTTKRSWNNSITNAISILTEVDKNRLEGINDQLIHILNKILTKRG